MSSIPELFHNIQCSASWKYTDNNVKKFELEQFSSVLLNLKTLQGKQQFRVATKIRKLFESSWLETELDLFVNLQTDYCFLSRCFVPLHYLHSFLCFFTREAQVAAL